jgi:hypothetical protein
MTWQCAACDKAYEIPAFVMNGAGKIVAQCKNEECLRTYPDLTPASFSTGLAAAPRDESSGTMGWGSRQAVVVPTGDLVLLEQAPRAPVTQVRGIPAVSPPPVLGLVHNHAYLPAPARVAAPPAYAPGDVLAWIEQRAAWLGAEEARLEGEIAAARASLAGVRAERKRLDKMQRAGRPEPAAAADTPVQRTLDITSGAPPVRLNN